MKEKKCTQCGNILPASINFFHIDKAGKYGLTSKCIKCRRENDVEYKKKNKEKIVKYKKEYNFKNNNKLKRYKEIHLVINRILRQKTIINGQQWEKIENIEEVLWELIDTVAYPFLTELEAKGLLEKLDSKGKTDHIIATETKPNLDSLNYHAETEKKEPMKIDVVREASLIQDKIEKASVGEKVRSAAHTVKICWQCKNAQYGEDLGFYEILCTSDGTTHDENSCCEKFIYNPNHSEINPRLHTGSKPPEPKCDDGSPIYPDIRDMYYSKKLGLNEPRAGEHFILRGDGTPNNPILRALFFGGDEEYIIDWKFRYKREYYEIVKREKIEFWRKELLNKTDEVLKSMREVLGIE